MADIDLDTAIRKLAKQQHAGLMATVKGRKARYTALAVKAKDPEARQRYRQLAKAALEEGNAAVRRLQMSADNIADSYARAIRRAVQAATPTAKVSLTAKNTPRKKRTRKPAT